jgi:hypothetical protein
LLVVFGRSFVNALGRAKVAGRHQQGAPLGTYANISPLVDFKGDFSGGCSCRSHKVDSETGEIVHESGQFDPVAARLERFALQSAARRILPNSRTAKCLRLRRKDKACVEVWRSVGEHGAASFGGLQTCASVWACPVCAAKISERRRVELLSAIEAHEATGGQVLLITLTNPHHVGDSLPVLLAGQQKAMSRFNSTKAALAMWDWMGCVGTVRAWEVTHGVNGWHPHFHLLAFVRPYIDLDAVRARVYGVWATACRLAGLPVPSFEHGADVRDGSEAASYASKWGLDHEMTKGHMKKARAIKGRSPFDLLRSYLHDNDKQAAALFREYAEAFHRKHQLEWSKGLKDRFGVGKESDEDVAARQDDKAELLGRIELEDWRRVLVFDLRGEVLELARQGWEPVQRLLDGLRRTDEAVKSEKKRFCYRE